MIKNKFGSYVIVGKKYLGQMTSTVIFNTSSKEDQLDVSGLLTFSFDKIGVKISGALSGDYDKKNIINYITVKLISMYFYSNQYLRLLVKLHNHHQLHQH